MKSTTAVNFETFYFNELISNIHKNGQKSYTPESWEYLEKLLQSLDFDADAQESIEKLAGSQQTSDLAIFFSDILDQLHAVSAEDALQKVDTYTEDFLEIFQVFLQQEEWKTAIDAEFSAAETAATAAPAEPAVTPVAADDTAVSLVEYCQHLVNEKIQSGKSDLPAEMQDVFVNSLSSIYENPAIADFIQDELPDPRATRFGEISQEISGVSNSDDVEAFMMNFTPMLSQWVFLFSGMLVEHYESLTEIYNKATSEAPVDTADETEDFTEIFADTADEAVTEAQGFADSGETEERPFEEMFDEAEAALSDVDAVEEEAAEELDAIVESVNERPNKPERSAAMSDDEKQRRLDLREYVISEVESYGEEALALIDVLRNDPANSGNAAQLVENLKGMKDLGKIHGYPGIEQPADRILQLFNHLQGEGDSFSAEDKEIVEKMFAMLPAYINAVVDEAEDSGLENILDMLTILKVKAVESDIESGFQASETRQVAFQDVAGRYFQQLHERWQAGNVEDAAISPALDNLAYWSMLLMPASAVGTIQLLPQIFSNEKYQGFSPDEKHWVGNILKDWQENFATVSENDWHTFYENFTDLLSGEGLSGDFISVQEAAPAFKEVVLRLLYDVISDAATSGENFASDIKGKLSGFFRQAQDNCQLVRNAELETFFGDLGEQLRDFDSAQVLDPEEFQDQLNEFLLMLKISLESHPAPMPIDELITMFDDVLNQVREETDSLLSDGTDKAVDSGFNQLLEQEEQALAAQKAADGDLFDTAEEDTSSSEIDEVFNLEASGYVDDMRETIEKLEGNLNDKDLWHELSITTHTLKGSAKMVGRSDIAELAEPVDDMIEKIGADELMVELEIVTVLSAFVDAVAERIQRKNADAGDVLEQLEAYSNKFMVEAEPEVTAEADTEEITIAAEAEETAEAAGEDVPSLEEFVHLKEQDPELLEIFQNEVGSNFDTVEKNLTNLEKFTYDKEAIQQVERAVHEIRSASKMLGVSEIADIADRMEKVCEKLILKEITDIKETVPVMRRGMYVIRELTTNHSIRQSIYDEVIGNLDLLLRGENLPDAGDVENAWETEPAEESFAAVSTDETSEETTVIPLLDQMLEDADDAEEAVVAEEAPAEAKFEPLPVAPQVLELYLQESQEQMDDINYILLKLEKDPDNEEFQQHLMRCMHTLKGSSGMVYASHIEKLAHRCEDIMEQNIHDKSSLDENLFDLLFEVMDEISVILDSIRDTSKEKVVNYADLLKKLTAYQEGVAIPATEEAPAEEAAEEAPAPQPVVQASPEESAAAAAARKDTFLRLNINKMNHLLNLAAELVISNNQFKNQLDRLKGLVPVMNNNLKVYRDTEDFLNAIVREGKQIQGVLEQLVENKPGVKDSLKKQVETVQRALKNVKSMQDEATTLSHSLKENSKTYDENLQKLNKLSNELLDEIMQARLVPINMLFQRFHRPIRDLARQLEKQIRLSIIGEETELDRTLIDELYEPLLHIIRNAIDHGLETVEGRKSSGKNPEGTLEIKASRDRNQVIIEVKDDGRGIDLERVKNSAISKGLLTEEDAETMSEQELFEYLFYPGFSTAKETTMVSGRGVGLDAVKTQIEKAKGDIRMYTEKGKGTSFSIRVPISLSVIQSMLVDVNGHVYSVPLLQVEETLHVSGQDILSEKGKFFIRYRERKIPVLQLSQLLRMRGIQEKDISSAASYPVIMVQDEGSRVALLVDKIIRREEILIKSLGPGLRRLKYISGGSIMADGQVVLVIDVPQIIQDLSKGEPMVKPEPAAFKEEADSAEAVITDDSEKSVVEPAAAPRPPRKRKRIEGRKPVALVVDDSLSIRKYLSSLLMQKGYATDTARNGYEALELLNKQDFDIMVTDLEMPKLSGYELIETLRYDQRFTGFPIIVLTGRAGDNFRQLTTELGADAYIIKPFKDRELFDQIDKFIEYKA